MAYKHIGAVVMFYGIILLLKSFGERNTEWIEVIDQFTQ